MVDEENEARRRASDLWWVELKISATRLGPLSGFGFFLAMKPQIVLITALSFAADKTKQVTQLSLQRVLFITASKRNLCSN